MKKKLKDDEKWRVVDKLGLAGYSKQLSKSKKNIERVPMMYTGSIENDPLWKTRSLR